MDRPKGANHLYVGHIKYFADGTKIAQKPIPGLKIIDPPIKPNPAYNIPINTGNSRQALSNVLYTTLRHKRQYSTNRDITPFTKRQSPIHVPAQSCNTTPTRKSERSPAPTSREKNIMNVYGTATSRISKFESKNILKSRLKGLNSGSGNVELKEKLLSSTNFSLKGDAISIINNIRKESDKKLNQADKNGASKINVDIPIRSKTPISFSNTHITTKKSGKDILPLLHNYQEKKTSDFLIKAKNVIESDCSPATSPPPPEIPPMSQKEISIEQQPKFNDPIEAYAARSKKGQHKDLAKINQDAFFICRNFAGYRNIWFLGVCDGHGTNGHLVSQFLKNSLPGIFHGQNLKKEIMESVDTVEKTKMFARRSSEPGYNKKVQHESKGLLSASKNDRASIIKEGFIKASHNLCIQPFDTSYSGSTVSSVFIIGNRIVCANIGDSRTILASYKSKGSTNSWIATPLSRDHKPTIPEENSRILKANGRIEAFKGIFSFKINKKIKMVMMWVL